MAATQAENQQNDVNSSEKVQTDQHLNLRNTLLQNGTEKSGIRGGNALVKGKASGTKNVGLDMSQYRQDGGSGTCGTGEQGLNTGAGLDTELGQGSGVGGVATVTNVGDGGGSSAYSPVSEGATTVPNDGAAGTQGSTSGPGTLHGYTFPFTARSTYNPEQHGPSTTVLSQNNTDGGFLQSLSQFGAQASRHSFTSKQPVLSNRAAPSPGPGTTGTASVSPAFTQQQQQRFLSAQTISQAAGPTPTLNQLLQNTNTMHRYPNNYSHGDQPPYGQSWPAQKPLPSYTSQALVSGPATAYRNQTPLSAYSGGPPPSSPSNYGQEPPPGVQGGQQSSVVPQQVGPGTQQQQSVGGSTRQNWNTGPQSQNQHPPASPGQSGPPSGSRHSPQPGNHSPGPGMPPSPQQQPPPSQSVSSQHSTMPPTSQSQSFPSRPPQTTTPNAHAPDAGDLTGQNSNDSSGGPAPGTPNSQGMRPTPSPTGSTGSRSMSPAVGQQSISMPPRPSSGQSDNVGPIRMSHSPMATQSGGYQHLGPPTHLHSYKMSGHPGMVPGGNQPMPMYNQQYPQAPSNTSGYPSRTQQYGPNQGYGPPGGSVQGNMSPGPGPGPGTGPGPGPGPGPVPVPGGAGPTQYPGRGQMSMPNHVPHPQFTTYQQQGWAGVNQPPPGPPPNHLAPNVKGPNSASNQQQQSLSVGGSTQTPNPSGPRPPHYLKQHLQHKIGYSGNAAPSMPPSPGPAQTYGAGAPGMGPPVHQSQNAGTGGVPMGPPVASAAGSVAVSVATSMAGGVHHHSGMGPPSSAPISMGPPNMAPPPSSGTPTGSTVGTLTTSSNTTMSNSHSQHDGPMPPPSSTPNSHSTSGAVHAGQGGTNNTDSDMLDNGITTTASGNLVTHVTPAAVASGGSVTSVVTTGPDGTPLDEGSQQSTLSNASAASGEDPQCTTPKSRKNELGTGGHYSHPATPQSTVPSPGAASMNSMHEEYDMSSPSWPRTPASPVFNSHVAPPDTYRSKKTDSLGKLYEMDDSPERRVWLDKLLAFMEERRTPITTCPTISKNPLDLFRLYIYVKERGGFMEVCKVTKNKTWKDIAGMLGIGASSSAAYTLRKHYTKNLLAYECQFDRGGIDPQPIINQVEASSKKKGAKATSVPSPGSSNSQDSFPAPGSSGASMDGYGGYAYPAGSTPDYNSPPTQRPSSQTNAPSPHGGTSVTNHHGSGTPGGPSPAAGTSDNINVSNPFDDVSPSPPPRPPASAQYTSGPHPPYGQTGPSRPQGIQQGYGAQSGYTQYPGPGPGTSPEQYPSYSSNSAYPPATRSIYPPYGPEGDRTYTQQSSNNMTTNPSTAPGSVSQGTTSTTQDPYRYTVSSAQVANYVPPRPYCQPSGAATVPPTSQQPTGPSYPSQPDYYRSEQAYASQQQGAPPPSPGSGPPAQIYPNGPPNKTMPPPAPQPRRHPDFAKDQQTYPPYGQQRPQLYGWPNSNQYRGQYQSPNAGPSTAQQWNQVTNRSTGPPHNTQALAATQWEHRYPASSSQTPYQAGPGAVQQTQQWSTMSTTGINQNSSLRPPIGPRTTFRSDGKPFNIMPPQGLKGNQGATGGGLSSNSYPQQPLPKREISFPSESVEATLPVLYRRKRICRADLGMLDAWRLMMSLRSGLLSETTYALDVLNVLLFDDSSVPYFGLGQWPGLLELLLEHFRKSLGDMFDAPTLREPDGEWYQSERTESKRVDLGAVEADSFDPNDKTILLVNTPNYTQISRKGQPVKLVDRTEDIFIRDNHKEWDVDGDAADLNVAIAVNTDPWQLGTSESSSTKYILPCFQSEFNSIPFCKLIETGCKNSNKTDETQINDSNQNCVVTDNIDNKNTTESVNVIELRADVLKQSDKRKRTKTLSDVISRIKKDSSDINVLFTQEFKEKVKTDSNGMKVSDNIADDLDLSPKSNNQNGLTVEMKTKMEPLDSDEENTNGSDTKMSVPNSDKLGVKDAAGTLKRRRMSDYEDECYTRDEASLCLITESQETIARRCVCISNILRNLTFIPGNEAEFARSGAFLGLLGKLLLLHHEHPVRTHKTRNYDREEDADFVDSCSSLQGESEWWWDYLVHIRENVLVSAANIAGHMDLAQYSEDVARPVLDGLLHWAVCPSAHGQDPFPSVGTASLLSPQRLALESLCKLCVTDTNVDLVIATPPFSRLERLCAVLTKHLCRSEDQVLREFSVNLLHYLAAADSAMARVVAMQSPCVSLLVAFIEQAEQSALGVANQHGIGALRENPDSMGTSLDMLRRAAGTLLHLAKHPDNRPLFIQQEQRLLQLVMSQILDQQVAFVIARVLYHMSRTSNENTSTSSNSCS